MKTKITPAAVRSMILKSMESDLPDRVIEALKPFDGKNITTRILSVLPALPNGATWHLIRHYGWTCLQTSTYCKPEGYADGTSLDLILARSEASVPLDLNYVAGNVPLGGNSYGENIAYFSARRERNAQRQAALDNPDLCAKTAAVMTRYVAAIAALEQSSAELEALTEYGTPLNPLRYELRRVVDPHEKAQHTAKK